MSTIRRWAVVAHVCAAVALFQGVIHVTSARAQATDDDARRHFRLGQAHYDNGSFLEAAHEFEQAYQLSNRPQLLYNVYVAYRDAGDLPHSRDALREYLARVPDAENAANLRARLEALDRMLAETATSSAATSGTETTVAASEPSPETATETATESAIATDASTTTATTTTSSGGGEASPVPWIVGGIGVAILAGAGITGGLALGSQSTLESRCPNRECPADYDFEGEASTGRTLAITSDVLLGTGIATVGVGIILLVVMGTGGGGEEAAPAPSASVGCDGTGCVASVRGRF